MHAGPVNHSCFFEGPLYHSSTTNLFFGYPGTNLFFGYPGTNLFFGYPGIRLRDTPPLNHRTSPLDILTKKICPSFKSINGLSIKKMLLIQFPFCLRCMRQAFFHTNKTSESFLNCFR